MELDEHVCHCSLSSETTYNISKELTDLLTKKMFDFRFDGQSNKNLSFRMWNRMRCFYLFFGCCFFR